MPFFRVRPFFPVCHFFLEEVGHAGVALVRPQAWQAVLFPRKWSPLSDPADRLGTVSIYFLARPRAGEMREGPNPSRERPSEGQRRFGPD